MIDANELKNLENLKEKKLITDEEYKKLRDNVINGEGKKKSQTAYCLLALFLGCMGVHNFYAGRWKQGLAQILIFIFLVSINLGGFPLYIWAAINIFKIDTDAQGREFIKNNTIKIVCGILTILVPLLIGGIAAFTVAMNR